MVKSVVGVASEARDHIERRRATIDHPDMDPAHIGHCIGYIAQVRSSFSVLAEKKLLSPGASAPDVCCG